MVFQEKPTTTPPPPPPIYSNPESSTTKPKQIHTSTPSSNSLSVCQDRDKSHPPPPPRPHPDPQTPETSNSQPPFRLVSIWYCTQPPILQAKPEHDTPPSQCQCIPRIPSPSASASAPSPVRPSMVETFGKQAAVKQAPPAAPLFLSQAGVGSESKCVDCNVVGLHPFRPSAVGRGAEIAFSWIEEEDPP